MSLVQQLNEPSYGDGAVVAFLERAQLSAADTDKPGHDVSPRFVCDFSLPEKTVQTVGDYV
jgi:hypothetical protein